jgi:hypothetical protein
MKDYMIVSKWKTTSIFWEIKEKLIFFENGRLPELF